MNLICRRKEGKRTCRLRRVRKTFQHMPYFDCGSAVSPRCIRNVLLFILFFPGAERFCLDLKKMSALLCQSQIIKASSLRERKKSCTSFASDQEKSIGVSVHLSTLKRQLNAVALKGCVAVKKLLLRPQLNVTECVWDYFDCEIGRAHV